MLWATIGLVICLDGRYLAKSHDTMKIFTLITAIQIIAMRILKWFMKMIVS